MNALTNKQREAISTWLDGEMTNHVLELPLDVPADVSIERYGHPTFSYLRVSRQKVAYRSGWWQYYAEGEGAEPLVFGRMRREPAEPFIRLSVREKVRRMQGDVFTPEEAQYLKDAITTKTHL